MAKQRDSCWFVVGYYTGDRPGARTRPRSFIYGVMGKRAAQRHAAYLQKKAGGQAANVIYEAYTCKRAPKLFSLKV